MCHEMGDSNKNQGSLRISRSQDCQNVTDLGQKISFADILFWTLSLNLWDNKFLLFTPAYCVIFVIAMEKYESGYNLQRDQTFHDTM